MSEAGFGDPWPLGVSLADGGLNVAVVSERARRIWICLFDPTGSVETGRFALPGRTADVHHGFVPGLGDGTLYGLRAEGPWQPEYGHRFDPAKLLVDPFALELDRPFAWHDDLAKAPDPTHDTQALVPKAIARRPPAERPRPAVRKPGIIYELGVTSFTRRHPGVPAARRGTIAALAEPAVLDHFGHLGIDTIELMPLAAWIDERHLARLGLSNAWGYNPVTFLAPDPRLAPGGMAEIETTLAALHRAGMQVLLDVVFNHTGEGDLEGPMLSLGGLDNALYYRHEADDPSRLVNDTGCGNTLALDRPRPMQLVLTALRHWARLGFDGFRFDLAPVMGRLPTGFSREAPLLQAIASDPELSQCLLIAEPWDVGPGGYQLGNFPHPWLEWNDRYRDDVRRFWRGRAGAAGALATRLAGSSDLFAGSGRAPSASINFVAAHDGFALADIVAFAGKHNAANGEENRDGSDDNHSWNNGVEGPTDDEAISVARGHDIRALLATLLVSRGTPMLTAGDEFGRTQFGNNNAYAQDNATTWLDWTAADRGLLQLTAELIRHRRAHPALTADRFLTGGPEATGALPDVQWLDALGRPMTGEDWRSADVLGVALYTSGDRVCLWFNRSRDDQTVTLPTPQQGTAWRQDFVTRPVSNAGAAAAASGQPVAPARSVSLWAEVSRR